MKLKFECPLCMATVEVLVYGVDEDEANVSAFCCTAHGKPVSMELVTQKSSSP